MRVDTPPFNDVRVRQAFRLIVDRKQMVEQVLSGQGRVANDMYSPYDPAYDSSLPQRVQDLAQAKSLLKQAGHAGPDGRARHLGRVPGRGGRRPGVRPAGHRCGGQGQRPQGRHRHVLRNRVPQVAVRPGLLGHARVPAAGRAGEPADLAVQRDPLVGPDVHQADQPGPGRGRREQAQPDPPGGGEDRVRPGRLHHPLLLEPDRRLQRQARRLRPAALGIPARQLLVQERRLRRHEAA